MAKKLGRGLTALFGNSNNDDCLTNVYPIDKIDTRNSFSQKHKNVIKNTQRVSSNSSSSGTPIMPVRNEEEAEIAKHIENAIHLPTSLQITSKGGKLVIKCKTYEELEILIKKLTADD